MVEPTKAVHTWSLFRTLGRYVAPGSMPSGDLPVGAGESTLLELIPELGRHGYRSIQLCHFYLPGTDPGYLAELAATLADHDVDLECFLIDDGDLTSTDPAVPEWVSGWCAVAEQLGAARCRVIAGKQPPTPERLDRSAGQLRRLARRHPGVRVVVENWHALLPDAASVIGLLDRTEHEVGFLIDLGNWTGPDADAQFAAVAPLAETCQAKCRTRPDGRLDLDRYRGSLAVLRDAGYAGPLAMVYDGPDDDEWGHLEREYAVVQEIFAPEAAPGGIQARLASCWAAAGTRYGFGSYLNPETGAVVIETDAPEAVVATITETARLDPGVRIEVRRTGPVVDH